MNISDVSVLHCALSVTFLLLLVITWLIGAFLRSSVMPNHGRLYLLGLLVAYELIAVAHLATDFWHRPPLTLSEYRWLETLGGLAAFFALLTLWRAGYQQWTRIRDTSSTDFLTFLLNRNGFMMALRHAAFTSGTLMVLDLNRLKWINDHHGHATGDRQIRDVAHARLCCLNWVGVGSSALTDLKPYRHRFPMTIIQHATWLYHHFPLSYRDVQALLHQRGIEVSHETLREWCIKFGALFTEELRHREPRPCSRWHLDEVCPSVDGIRHW